MTLLCAVNASRRIAPCQNKRPHKLRVGQYTHLCHQRHVRKSLGNLSCVIKSTSKLRPHHCVFIGGYRAETCVFGQFRMKTDALTGSNIGSYMPTWTATMALLMVRARPWQGPACNNVIGNTLADTSVALRTSTPMTPTFLGSKVTDTTLLFSCCLCCV